MGDFAARTRPRQNDEAALTLPENILLPLVGMVDFFRKHANATERPITSTRQTCLFLYILQLLAILT